MAAKEDILNDINIVTTFSSKYDMKSPAEAGKYIKFFEEKKVFKTQIGIKYLERLKEIKEGKTEELCFVCKKDPSHDGVLCDACMSKYTKGKKTFFIREDEDDLALLDELFAVDSTDEGVSEEPVISTTNTDTTSKSATPTQKTNTSSGDESPIWYYRTASKEKKGPCTERQIEELVNKGVINKNTSVWRKDWGEGADKWKNISNTSLKYYIKEVLEYEALPPELKVSDKLLWVWAFVPILSLILNLVVPKDLEFLTYIPFIINTVFIIVDINYLKKNNVKVDAWMWVGLLLVPIYIFVRINRTSKKYGPGIVWIITFALSLIVAVMGSAVASSPHIAYEEGSRFLVVEDLAFFIPDAGVMKQKDGSDNVYTYTEPGASVVFTGYGNTDVPLDEIEKRIIENYKKSFSQFEVLGTEPYMDSSGKVLINQTSCRGVAGDGPFVMTIYTFIGETGSGAVIRLTSDFASRSAIDNCDFIIQSTGDLNL